MKRRIVHILDDQNLGGVRSTTAFLSNSPLQHEFEFELLTSRDAIAALKSRPADLVIYHNPCSWQRSLNLLCLKKYTSKLLIHEHHYSAGFEQWKVTAPKRFQLMLRWCYGLADQVIAISRSQQQWMQDNRLVAADKLTLIQQCPQLDALFKVPEKMVQQPLILGAYGRFHQQKGFDVLMQAMQLVQDLPLQLHLGGYGEDEAHLQELAQGMDNVKFWGVVKDVPGFLAGTDIAVIPSRWEPWGNVCAEVKAAGKPAIVSDVDGLSEQVQVGGVLVLPNDPEQLAHAIREVAALPSDTLKDWGQSARDSMVDAWDAYIERWQSLLLKMLN